MEKLSRWSILALVGVLCSGCIDATTLVTVKKDGSGTIEESVYISKAVEQMLKEMTAAMGGETASAPKTSQIDESKLKAKAAKMGAGVRFVSANEVKKADGSMGTREVYAFSDIRTLKLQSDPDTSALGGAAKPRGGPRDSGGPAGTTKKASPPLTFDFSMGDASTLTIRLPEPQSGKTEDASDGKARPDMAAPSPQERAMMKRMFDGFRFRMLIKVDGEITQTNASYAHQGNDGKTQYVTLFDMNIGELLKDEEQFNKLVSLGKMEDMATAKTKLLGILGLKIETVREVTVSFK